jgi:hypothetical protein
LQSEVNCEFDIFAQATLKLETSDGSGSGVTPNPIPSGKHTKNYGKSPFFNGKINYFYGHGFNSKLSQITRGYLKLDHDFCH